MGYRENTSSLHLDKPGLKFKNVIKQLSNLGRIAVPVRIVAYSPCEAAADHRLLGRGVGRN